MIYKIRIILDAQDDVFRDVEIESDNTLEELHNAIIQSFGLEGHEMACFYTCDADWNQGEEIPLFAMDGEEANSRLMQDIPLEAVLTGVNSNMIYIYDFLSMWMFLLELVDIGEREHGQTYPNVRFSFGTLPDAAPEKNFGATPSQDFDDLDVDDPNFDENWN